MKKEISSVKYNLKTNKINKNYLIALLTDFSYQGKEDFNNLYLLAQDLNKEKPDIICITGDLFSNIAEAYETKEYKIFLKWLNLISKIAPVFMVKGDRDYLVKTIDGYIFFDSENIFKEIASLPRVALLSYPYSKITYQDLVITGLDSSYATFDYYIQNKENALSYLDILREKINIIESHLDSKQYNILLFHSPNYLFRDLNHPKYSLYLTGHNLNGYIPTLFDDLTGNCNFGLMNSQGKFLAKHCRNCEKLTKDGSLYGLVGAPALPPKNLKRVRFKPSIRYIDLEKEA